MIRTILGYAVLAIVGLVALKLVFGLLSIAFTLFWAALWLAVLGFIFYLVLKVISPRTAERVREAIKGERAE
jgi:hypothetical protein